MKIAYITSARIPDDWAHVLQILTMCESFANAGVEVTLLAPKRANTRSTDPFEYASVKKNFTIKKLPCLDLFPGTNSTFFFYLRTITFLVSARLYLLFHSGRIMYTREHLASLFFRDFIYELHSRPDAGKGLYKRLWKKARGFVVLTSFMKQTLVTAGVTSDHIHVAPDAVRFGEFASTLTKREARRKFDLSENTYLYGYVGTLKTMQMEKGVACGIDALRSLPENMQFIVVGGESEDIAEYKAYALEKGVQDRVVFIGKVQRRDVPQYLNAFDAVVAPFPDFEHYRLYMSPLKIFEYMAAGIPMIVSDLPSLREVLTGETAYFIPPADSDALAKAVLDLKSHPEHARLLAEAAQESAKKEFTWDARARGILAFILSNRD